MHNNDTGRKMQRCNKNRPGWTKGKPSGFPHGSGGGGFI